MAKRAAPGLFDRVQAPAPAEGAPVSSMSKTGPALHRLLHGMRHAAGGEAGCDATCRLDGGPLLPEEAAWSAQKIGRRWPPGGR